MSLSDKVEHIDVQVLHIASHVAIYVVLAP